MDAELKLLMVEDLIFDADLIKHEITRNGISIIDLIVETKEDYVKAIYDFKPDFILSDYSLPSFNGKEALLIRNELAPFVPFILVTGSINEETAVEIMKCGADDYVLKDRLTHLPTSIISAIEKSKMIKSKKEAEDKLRILSRAVEQNPASIIITNKAGNIEYINPKFSLLTGYTLNEVVGQNPRILKSGITPPEKYKDLWKTITSGGEWHGEFQNKKKNGESYFETATISPILDENGVITHFLAVKEDVTEKKKSEELIKTLSKALEQSPTAIIITNEMGEIQFANTMFTSFMQYSFEEVSGKYPRIFNPGHVPAEEFEHMWKTLRSGNIWKSEFLNRKKDKTVFWENVVISPLLNKDNVISNYILIMEDVTEKKNLLTDLVFAKEKAEENDRLKTAFLQNISHEIRTPMNSIIGFSSLLSDPNISFEQQSEFTDIIIRSSNQLLSIITDIINIATIEAGQEKVNERETNVNSVCNLIANIFSLKVKEKGLALDFKYALSDKDALMITDEAKLTVILSNLVSNAIKFTVSGYVHFGYIIEDNYLKFYVEDTGIGINPELHDEIFIRFRQIETTDNRKYGGTGLGLSISKAYVDLLGGKIWLDSELGKGCIFYFTIPFKKNEINL